jgi:TolB-like protein
LNTRPDSTFAPYDLLSPQPWRPLVALLPFTHGADPELRLLGGEIADLLRERLARDPALQSILISSDFLAKAPPHALDLVCRELRVGYVISGKCHGDADEPSLYVELADTHDWNVQWAHFFGGTARSLLSPDSTAMREVAAALRRELVMRPRR